MLSIAAGFAESEGYGAIIIGNQGGDHAAYPDCTTDFIGAMGKAVMHGTNGHVRILSPFCKKDKTHIIRLGDRLGVDFENAYSCYEGGKDHCAICATCRERKEAFETAGVKDVTRYAKGK
jgi:7-cyano-7-deazaguanine synthase